MYGTSHLQPFSGCTRKDYVSAALVQAALSVQRIYGTARARALLERERIHAEVIARVLSPHGRSRQAVIGAAGPLEFQMTNRPKKM